MGLLDKLKGMIKPQSKPEVIQPVVFIDKSKDIPKESPKEQPKEKTPMQISQTGLDLIKKYEGLELKAYPDPASGGDPWTIGYGHTGPEVKKGLEITEAQANAYLAIDCRKFEKAILGMVTKELTQNQFDALVSFCYNLGPGALQQSTLLKKINAGDMIAAADQFLVWNKAKIKGVLTVMPGLDKRRKAERALFLS